MCTKVIYVQNLSIYLKVMCNTAAHKQDCVSGPLPSRPINMCLFLKAHSIFSLPAKLLHNCTQRTKVGVWARIHGKRG